MNNLKLAQPQFEKHWSSSCVCSLGGCYSPREKHTTTAPEPRQITPALHSESVQDARGLHALGAIDKQPCEAGTVATTYTFYEEGNTNRETSPFAQQCYSRQLHHVKFGPSCLKTGLQWERVGGADGSSERHRHRGTRHSPP